MQLTRHGHIFSPDGSTDWMKSHAAVPIAKRLKGSLVKVYFSSRNAQNQANIGFVILDMEDPFQILEISETPLLLPGKPGRFDEDGIMASDIITVGGKDLLYYFGWNIGGRVPFRNAIGLAVSDQGKDRFEKFSEGPVLDRNVFDHCFVSNPCVQRMNDSFIMYYISCSNWERKGEELKHYYDIRIATSSDGYEWRPTGRAAISHLYPNEYAISVPRVMAEDSSYRMFYSFRGGPWGEQYRIGYAESLDGYQWTRKDAEIHYELPPSGWDSEMICYAYPFKYRDKLYLFYNGNGYGKTGFGLAELTA